MIGLNRLFFFKPYPAYGNRAEDMLYAALLCKREKRKLILLYNPITIIRYRKANIALCKHAKSTQIEINCLPVGWQFVIHAPLVIIRVLGFIIRKVCPIIGDGFVKISDFTIGRDKLYGNISGIDNYVDKTIDWKSDFSINAEKPLLFYKSREWIDQRIPSLKNKKYICIHVRTGDFHGDHEFGAARNSTFSNYAKSIRYLVANGYIVVRIGANKKEWVEIEGCINIDTNGDDGELLDIAVIEHCEMYIGGYSGPMDVALMFGKKIYAVNIISLSHCAWNTKLSRFLPKKVKLDGKIITLEEQIRKNIFEITGTGRLNPDAQFLENTEEEIYEGLLEFMANQELDDDQEKMNIFLHESFKEYADKNQIWSRKNDDTLQKVRWMSKMQGIEGGVCRVALRGKGEN